MYHEWEREECIRVIGGKAGKKETTRRNKMQVGRLILKWILLREIGWDGMDWIDLAQDRDQWGAPVNTVMNLRVP
jgi:hypothetical protein